jgi:hypothetical protein
LFVILFPFSSERIDQLKRKEYEFKELMREGILCTTSVAECWRYRFGSGPSCHADAIDANASVIDTVASLPQDCGFCKTTRLECEFLKQLDLLDKAGRF